MGILEEQALKKQIRENTLSRVYLIYGDEPYLVAQYAAQMAAKAAGTDFAEFNLQYFDDESSVDEIEGAVEALPMMAERKCVVVRNYNAEAASASATEKMEQLLQNPPDSCVLIFKITSGIVNTKKSAKWRNFIKAVAAVGEVTEVPRRDEVTLAKFLVAFAEKRGCTLSGELARAMVRSVGTELYRLTAEMEKLCAYANGGELTYEMMETVAAHNNETVIFRLTDALAAQDYDHAYRLLDALFFQREEPIVLLSAISGAYVDLYRARAALDSGINAMTLAPKLDYRGMDFKLKGAMRNCRNYSLRQLRDIMQCLYDADTAMKSVRIDGRILLEQTIAKILLITAKRG